MKCLGEGMLKLPNNLMHLNLDLSENKLGRNTKNIY